MLQIFVNHFVRDVSSTPTTKANRPKVTTLIFLLQFGEFQLEFSRTSTFQFLYQCTHILGGAVFQMHMNVVFANNSFQNLDSLSIAYFDKHGPTTFLNITDKHRIPVLCTPNYMHGHSRYRMSIDPLSCYNSKSRFF